MILKRSKRARHGGASRRTLLTRSSPFGRTHALVLLQQFHPIAHQLTTITAQYTVSQTGTEINTVQKQIGLKKKAKEDAEDLLLQKTQLEKRRTAEEEIVAAKRAVLQEKARLVGNYVKDSVPVSYD